MTELNKHYKVATEPLFHPNTASLAFQYSPYWKAREAFLIYYGVKSDAKPHKKAREISKTDFYFVIGFYHLYDICMRHEGMFFRHEGMFFRLPAMPT